MKVLVVEDDPKIRSFVRKGLEEQGFVVDDCGDGDEGLERALHLHYDAVVLDIMLPGRDGLSVLRELRAGGHGVPVVLLTARASLDERVEGLDLGADDYLTKPFYVEELVARLHAVSRRAAGDPVSVLEVGELRMELLTREVRRGEHPIELTARELELLRLLMRSPGRVYSRTQILEHVWGYDFDPQTNVVDVYVRRLRRKIDAGDGESLVETVRGVGYRLRRGDAT